VGELTSPTMFYSTVYFFSQKRNTKRRLLLQRVSVIGRSGENWPRGEWRSAETTRVAPSAEIGRTAVKALASHTREIQTSRPPRRKRNPHSKFWGCDEFGSGKGTSANLSVGRLKQPVAVFTDKTRTNLSEPGCTSVTRARGQRPLGNSRLGSSTATRSPTRRFRLGRVHFTRCWRVLRYSRAHRCQNCLRRACTSFQCVD
jgi:hypothetical protein